jgi:hypothetical protein
MPSVVLIVGAAGPGKSSLCKFLHESGAVGATISCDAHRYVPGAGWAKRPLREYVDSVCAAIRAAEEALGADALIAVDTTVFDSSDPEDARGACARYLCEQKMVRKIVYLHMDQARMQLGLITRIMRRAKGVEPQNPAADETPQSVQRMLNKNARFDEVTLPKIREFLAFAKAANVPVLEREAIPLPEVWDTPVLDQAVFESYRSVVTD